MHDRRNERSILLALVIAETTAGFETTMVLTALAKLALTYRDVAMVGWLVSGYLLVATAAAAIASRLGDIYDRRKMLIITLAFAVAGSTISAMADDLRLVIAGRCLQGMAGAILPLCLGLVRERIDPSRISNGIGTVTATASLSAAGGLILGGIIVDQLSWHYIFVVSAVTGLLSIVAVTMLIPAPAAAARVDRPRVDIVGGVLFAPAIAAILLAVTNGARWGWTSMPTLALACGGLLVLALWVRHELRHPDPLIDIRLFLDPRVRGVNLCIILMGLGALQPQLVLMLLQQPVWTGIGLGVSAAIAGFIKAPAQMIGAASSFFGGKIAGSGGGLRLLLWGTGAILTGWVGLWALHHSLVGVLAAYTLAGIGTGLVMTAGPLLVITYTPKNRTSEAAGLLSVSRTLGTAIGAQLLAVILNADKMVDAAGIVTPHPSAQSYMIAFGYVIAISACCFAAACSLAKRQRAG